MSYRPVALALIVALVLGVGESRGQPYGSLPDSIPDRYAIQSLQVGLNGGLPGAVVRLDARRLEIEDENEATYSVRRVVTLLRDGGRNHGRVVLPYDSFVEIEELEGRILDPEGETVQELGDEHVQDRSAIQSFSVYSDARVRVAQLSPDEYPRTIEYRYEVEISSPLRWPVWYPVRPTGPTQFAQFEVDFPASDSVRYRLRGDAPAPTKRRTEEGRVLRWRLINRPAYDPEPLSPSWRRYASSVRVAPTSFSVAGTRGDMSTWAAFGAWYHRLKRDRDTLGPEAVQQVHRIVHGASSRRDSVRRVYRSLQRDTRYVSVQLGIGGWRPFPPSYVRERGYGDCKALTNYMEAVLASVGISSHPVLIHRGIEPVPVPSDFPSPQFNHVILAVPMPRDTLWLENTDTTAPFGHVAADIEDRNALLVTPAGGELVRTPDSPASENRQIRNGSVQIAPDGDGVASVRTTYTGNQQDRVRRTLVGTSSAKRRQWLQDRIQVPNFEIARADFSDVNAYRDTVRLPVRLNLSRYASSTGRRLFVPLNLMQRQESVPQKMDRARTQPVRTFPYSFTDVDSVRYALPSGYRVEAVPDPVSVTESFATYVATATDLGDTLVYRRRLVWRDETLPPSKYEDVRSFLETVARADDAQAVLVEEGTER